MATATRVRLGGTRAVARESGTRARSSARGIERSRPLAPSVVLSGGRPESNCGGARKRAAWSINLIRVDQKPREGELFRVRFVRPGYMCLKKTEQDILKFQKILNKIPNLGNDDAFCQCEIL